MQLQTQAQNQIHHLTTETWRQTQPVQSVHSQLQAQIDTLQSRKRGEIVKGRSGISAIVLLTGGGAKLS